MRAMLVSLLCYFPSIVMVVVSASSYKISSNVGLHHHINNQYKHHIVDETDNNDVLASDIRQKSVVTTTSPSSSSVLQSTILPLSRGGASALIEEEEEGANIVLVKLRNIIRSILQISERKSPAVANCIRKMIQMLESITGVRLLPIVKKEASSSKGKKRKKSAKPTKNTEDEEQEIVAKKTESSKKKKQTSSSSKPKQPKKTPSATAQKHLSTKLKSTSPNYRLQKELRVFLTSPPPNLSVSVGKNIRVWIVTITGAANTIYEGEKYRLRMQFPPNYPTSPPSVYFLPPTPKHEHVYTNGDICLSLLGKDWRPTMTGQSLAVSILSLLSSAREKSLPMDNARHAQNKPGGNQDNWVYHDDNC